jgi:YVTN family beta-propeller protein
MSASGAIAQEVATPTFVAVSLLPDGRKPSLPAFTPDHRFLLVPNEETDNLTVVNCERLSIVTTIKLRERGRPWQAKVTPDGRFAYVTNSMFWDSVRDSPRSGSVVSVVDLREYKVIKEIPVGAGPNGVTVDLAGKRGYVANMRSDNVTVIDVGRHEAITDIPTGRAPAFAKLTRDGQTLVVTNFEDSTLTLIDTSRLDAVNTVQVGIPRLSDPYPEWGPGDTTGVAITHDKVAYVTNYRSHTIAVVNLLDYSVERLTSPVKHPFGVEIDRELGLVVISSGQEKAFAILDVKTNETVAKFPCDGTVFPTGPFAKLNLWMTDPKNHRITALLPMGVRGIAMDWDKNMVTKFM